MKSIFIYIFSLSFGLLASCKNKYGGTKDQGIASNTVLADSHEQSPTAVNEKLMIGGEKSRMVAQAPSIRFRPPSRAVGDVMPFYHNGEYHIFYLLNASSNNNINWEHAVSKDLVHWKNLPSAILHDPMDKTGPEGGCMFTGSIIEHEGIFHAFYTSWNPENPDGREFICHATSKYLINWTKHPEDMFGPDGIHYADHRLRDFRDPHVIWDEEEKQFVMYINGNQPNKEGFVYGKLTSKDLKHWKQLPAIETIPGDECPDFFKSGSTYYLHGCNVYAYSESKNGPWKFPSNNKVDKRMAAKTVSDGKRRLWFGGWLGGPMSIPREVYEGPDGLLFMKPVPEVENVFTEVSMSMSNVKLKTGTWVSKSAPQDYLLEATVDLSKGQELVFFIFGEKVTRIVLSAAQKRLEVPGLTQALPIDFTRPVKVQAFIVDGVAEIFVNSKVAATCLIDSSKGMLGLSSRGTVMVPSLQAMTPERYN